MRCTGILHRGCSQAVNPSAPCLRSGGSWETLKSNQWHRQPRSPSNAVLKLSVTDPDASPGSIAIAEAVLVPLRLPRSFSLPPELRPWLVTRGCKLPDLEWHREVGQVS